MEMGIKDWWDYRDASWVDRDGNRGNVWLDPDKGGGVMLCFEHEDKLVSHRLSPAVADELSRKLRFLADGCRDAEMYR